MAYRVFFEEAINPFCLLDSEGRVKDWNKKSEEVFGYSAREVQGNFDPTFPNRKAYLAFLRRIREKGKVVEAFTLLTREGEELDVEVTGVYRDGEYFLMKRDLTYRRYAYIEKMKAIGELVAGIAHQLNSPLNSIILMTQMLAEELGEEERRQDLLLIERQARQMKSVIEKILNFARFSAQMNYFCIMEAMREIAELYQKSLKKHRIRLNIYSRHPELCRFCGFFGDRSAIQQALINLISNAVDAMPRGGEIEVTCSAEEDEVIVQVKDQGVGIRPENFRRIFQPFYTTKGSRGTGLGLAIVKRIVEEHRGRIEVQSTPGKGTTFTLRFPARMEVKGHVRPPAR